MGLWVFGYASLLWNVGFDFDEELLGFIKGFKRAFHLACFEHRGTPDFPARVPTLEPDEASVCWGVAYHIKDPVSAETAVKYLMDRETEYDDWRYLEFFTEQSTSVPKISNALVFMSSTTSKYYLGPASRDKIAQQVAIAKGPSGPNCDYLFRLVQALKDIGHEDEEITALAESVKYIQHNLRIKCIADKNDDINNVPFNIALRNGAVTLPILEEVINLTTNIHHLQPLSPKLLKGQTY